MTEDREPEGLTEKVLYHQKRIMTELAGLRKKMDEPDREWWTVPQMAKKKGVSPSWLQHNPWAQPEGGSTKKLIAGHMRCHWSVVSPWLVQSDDDLVRVYGSKKDRERVLEPGLRRVV
jgi:hypothetical protein